MVFSASFSPSAQALQTVPYKMNFQGRLTDAAGNAKPNGTYNMKFRIYDASTGGTQQWTETRANSASTGVTVTNGLFSVQLGDVTSLPPAIFTNQNLYFEIELPTPGTATCTTASCESYTEGPMGPRNKLGTSAYAFNSDTLDGLDSTAFAAASGSANYIQNTTTPQTANFSISGTGAATALQSGSLDAATAGTLTIGGANATSITMADDVSIAVGKTITMIGGATNLRPASPSEGMIYFDTDIKQLLVYSNGKWQGDRSTATAIVGTSAVGGTSGAVASKNPAGADFVNTSDTSAQTVINQAIASLPATGGSIYLMEGTYIVDGSINLPNDTSIIGAGAATVLKVKNAYNAGLNVLKNSNSSTGTRVVVQNLRIDGNKANQTAGLQFGIYFYGMGAGSGATARDGGKIINVTVRDMYSYGISVSSSSNNTLTGNTVQGNGSVGISLPGSNYNTLTGNTVQGNGSFGISLSSSSNYNTLSGNTVQGNNSNGIALNTTSNNTLTGNTVQGNNSSGIDLTSSSLNTVTANTVQGNSYIGFNISNSSGNTLTGNTVSGNSYYGIRISSSSKNLVTNNGVHDNGGVTYNSIQIDGTAPDYNTITANYITDTAGGVRAITISAGTGTYLADNRFGTGADGVWNAAGPLSDAGTETIFANQVDGNGKLISRSSGGMAVQNTSGSDVLSVNASTSLLTVNGTALYSSASTTGFVVQNSSNAALFTADTQNNKVVIGSGANGIEFSANGIVLLGTARGTDRLVLSAEYPGLTFRGDGTNNNGSLSSDFCSQPLSINTTACSTGVATNYYQWTTAQVTAQDYDLYLKLRYPSRASASNAGGVSSFTMEGFVTSTTTDSVQATIYKGATTCGSYNVATTNNTWTATSLTGAFSTCTFSAGEEMIIKITLTSGQNNFARVGDIALTFLAQR